MIAARDLKYAAGVGENAFFYVLDPGPVHAHRHLILGLARHRAGVTSDAGALVDRESISHVHRPIVMIDDRMQNFPARELSRI